MPCSLAAAISSATACPPPAPGLDETKVWLINRADITWTGGTNNQYTNIALAGVTVAYRCSFHNKGFNFTDELSINDTSGAGSWAPKLNFRSLGLDGATAQSVENLLGVDVVAIVYAKNGKFLVFGSQAGLKLMENTTGSEPDTLGESVVLGGEEEPAKHYNLLITDAATTLSTLVGLE